MVTLSDVAAAAGVSVATASRAINAHPNVDPATRRKVLDMAARLHFQPSHAARALRMQRTNVIGVVVPDISSVFYATAIRTAEHTLRRHGYTLFIADTEEDPRLEVEIVETLLAHRVGGLILAPAAATAAPLQQALSRDPVPVVTVDNRVDGLDADTVLHDNVGGMQTLVAHLVGHGHRRIALLGGLQHETGGRERLAGYTAALVSAGIPLDPDLIREGDWTRQAGFDLMAALLALPDPPTAVAVASFAMVVGALLALRASGRRVPDDMALVSFDDTPSGPVMDPPITALEARDADVGRLAAEMLLTRLQDSGPRGYCDVRLPLRLVRRRSCGCEEGEDR